MTCVLNLGYGKVVLFLKISARDSRRLQSRLSRGEVHDQELQEQRPAGLGDPAPQREAGQADGGAGHAVGQRRGQTRRALRGPQVQPEGHGLRRGRIHHPVSGVPGTRPGERNVCTV